jgi:hypothetical protein
MSTQKRLTLEKEEKLWAISAVPLIPIFIYVIVYHIFPIASSFKDLITYGMLVLVLYLFTVCGIYEIASSFRVKRAFSFRAKRFLSRAAFTIICTLCFHGLWNAFMLLFPQVLNLQYVLILSLFVWALALAAFLQNPRTRQIIKKLTQEEASH